MCSDADKRQFGTLRSKPDKILLVVKLLTEGMGIRSAGRTSNCHRDTVLRILKHVGTRCYEHLQKKLVGVNVKHLEADETWTFVQRKSEKETNPERDHNPWGDFYIFLGMDADTKLMLMPQIGKRNELRTELFANELAKSTTGHTQLTTDGFPAYKKAMKNAFGSRIDFAQLYKEHHMHNAISKDKKPEYLIRCGAPDPNRITTAHVERVNLTLRTHNKRFNRKTICFSKDEEYLAYSGYLWAAEYNFCRINKGILGKQTPAMAAGILESKWECGDLLKK
jgi:IS1 family transposase